MTKEELRFGRDIWSELTEEEKLVALKSQAAERDT
jgi:hypothetical protein